jgi:hypothetical protein
MQANESALRTLWWIEIGHAYRPVKHFGGQVLKYAGRATHGNVAVLLRDGCTIHATMRDRGMASNFAAALYLEGNPPPVDNSTGRD